MPIPKKAAVLSIFLFIVGTSFASGGVYSGIVNEIDKIAILYFGFGIMLIIPGAFYILKLWEAYRTKDMEYRRQIIDDIPVWNVDKNLFYLFTSFLLFLHLLLFYLYSKSFTCIGL